MAEHLHRYGEGPICPRCGWDQFDDWWHVLKETANPYRPKGRIDCGDCKKWFTIEGAPGSDVWSTCFGVERRAE